MRLRPRYFVALLWHWSIPFVLGACAGSIWYAIALFQSLPELEQVLTRSIESACSQPGQTAQRSPREV